MVVGIPFTIMGILFYTVGWFPKLFHDKLGIHRPDRSTAYTPWMALSRYAKCRYCGKEIWEWSDYDDWDLVDKEF